MNYMKHCSLFALTLTLCCVSHLLHICLLMFLVCRLSHIEHLLHIASITSHFWLQNSYREILRFTIFSISSKATWSLLVNQYNWYSIKYAHYAFVLPLILFVFTCILWLESLRLFFCSWYAKWFTFLLLFWSFFIFSHAQHFLSWFYDDHDDYIVILWWFDEMQSDSIYILWWFWGHLKWFTFHMLYK